MSRRILAAVALLLAACGQAATDPRLSAPSPSAATATPAAASGPAATTACYPEGGERLAGPVTLGASLRMSLVAVEPSDRITNQLRWTLRFELPAGAPAPARIAVQSLIAAGERSQLHILGYEIVGPTGRSVPESEVVDLAPCGALTLAIRTAGPLFDGTYPYSVKVWKVGLPEGSTVTGDLSLRLSCSNATFTCARVDVAATPAPAPTVVPGVLDPSFGVIYSGTRSGWEKGSAPQVRREGETTAVGELAPSYFNQFNGSLAPDGRRAVYFAQGQGRPWGLYLLDGARPNEQRQLLSIPGEVPYSRPIWSADATGVLFSVADEGAVQGVRPRHSAIRTLDLASGAVAEVARVEGGDSYGALGWDRAGGALAYLQQPHGGPARTYVARTAAGTRTWTVDRPFAMYASPDAREVLGVDCSAPTGCAAASWKLGDFDARTPRPIASGLHVSVIGWRAATNEVVAIIGGTDATSARRIAVWSPGTGATRDVYQLGDRHPSAFLRADGSAVILERGIGDIVVVDLATGRSSPLPQPVPREPYEVGRPTASVRLR